MAATRRIRFGIRLKLFLLVLVSFGVLIAVLAWRVGVESSQAADKSIAKSLNQAEVILSTSLNTRFNSILETTRGIATDPRVLPLVVDSDKISLQDFIGELVDGAKFDLIFLTNRHGILLARSDKPELVGRDLKGKSALVDEPLAGRVAQGFMLSGTELYQVVSVPIYDNVARNLIRGMLAVAYRLSPDIALNINKLTESQIGFYAFDKSGTGSPRLARRFMTAFAQTDELDKVLATFNLYDSLQASGANQQLSFRLGKDKYNAVLHPLSTQSGGVLGFVIALQSQTELLRPFVTIQHQVFMVGGVCLLVASVMAWWIASRIAKPIIHLAGVARHIQEGEALDGTKPYPVNDEVGLLSDAVVQMGRELKNKADLEQYLANLAEDLDDDLLLSEAVGEAFQSDAAQSLEVLERTMTFSMNAAGLEETQRVEPKQATVVVRTSAATLETGQLFAGRYQILRAIGSGAMGEVFVARDITLDEVVAVKVLFARGLDSHTQNLFKEEIRLARKITHRNILRTFDFGVAEDNKMYISMEYVHGQDLNALLNKIGKLELKIGVMLARQICSAIAAAHQEGIIHRDLNPRNMMVNKMGVLKVMDFGLAMRVEDQVRQQVVVGTPYYLSPEQIRREVLDQRTDIYAIGVILFKIFSGQAPFVGHELSEILNMHLANPVPHLSSRVSGIPAALDNIICTAMAKDPLERFQSVAELQTALQQLEV